MGRLTILQRVERDVESGDLGLARQRLAAHLNSAGYDAELLAKLGELSHQMHDRFTAGKYWLLSSAEGEQVETAVREYARRCANSPAQMLKELPRRMFPKSLEEMPDCARTRVAQYFMEDLLVIAMQSPQKAGSYRSTFMERLSLLGMLCFFLFIAICACAGLGQVGRWISSLLSI